MICGVRGYRNHMLHPYQKFQSTPLWQSLEEGVRELVANHDLKLETPLEYVVGYLCEKALAPHGIRDASESSLPRDFTLHDGEVRGWIEQECSIHLKVASLPHGDPVELTSANVREIGVALQQLALALESSEAE